MAFNTQLMLPLSNILTKTKEEFNLESLKYLKKNLLHAHCHIQGQVN